MSCFESKKLTIPALASALVCRFMCLKKRNFKNKPTQLNSKTRPNTIEFDGFNYARLIDMHRFARNLKHVYTLAYDNNHMDGQPKVDGRDVAEVET
jgi:hypothetical protein